MHAYIYSQEIITLRNEGQDILETGDKTRN